jgi:thioredoxin reductase (NADPH)
MRPHDLVIVGGGPAGLAAGIQAVHMGLKAVALEKEAWGGRLRMARKVENIPGLRHPLRGVEVVDRIVSQARAKGLTMERHACMSLDYQEPLFKICGAAHDYQSHAVIVACGTRSRRLELPGPADASTRLFYSWRDLPAVRGRKVAIVGGGEAALDQACSLAEDGALVTVLIRSHQPRSFKGLVWEAERLGVRIFTDTEIRTTEVKEDRLILEASGPHASSLSVDYLLAAVGVEPVDLDMTFRAAEREGHGLYWAGDVKSGRFRQAAIAFGDGIRAAMMVCNQLRW